MVGQLQLRSGVHGDISTVLTIDDGGCDSQGFKRPTTTPVSPPTNFRPASYEQQWPPARRRGPRPSTWFLWGRSLFVWPVVFATAVI